VLHRLHGTKKAHDACRLVESLVNRGRRLVVWVGDEGRAQVLDDYLWTFSQSSFVAHVRVQAGGSCEEPVAVLSARVENPNRADTLVIVDRLADPSAAAGFSEVHDLDAGTEEDGGKSEAWRQAGFEVVEVTGLGAP